MLHVKNVTKKYGANLVLHIPLLQLQNGIYWIKGANGSGKTTFLKMIAGLLPFEGDILLNDISLKNKPVRYRQAVSWSEAEPLFPSFMTGINLIRLYRSIRKASHEEADTLISLLNMNDYINDAIGTYSAGMIKKLSLLLSFLGNPSLVILDEPLITLDANTVAVICAFLVEKNKKNGTGFLMSSHQDIDTQLLSFDKEFLVQNKTVITE